MFEYGRRGFWEMGCGFFCHGPWEMPFCIKEQELRFVKKRATTIQEALTWIEECIKELEEEE